MDKAGMLPSPSFPHKVYIHFIMECKIMKLGKWGGEGNPNIPIPPYHFPSSFYQNLLIFTVEGYTFINHILHNPYLLWGQLIQLV